MWLYQTKKDSGFTLIEVVIVIGITVLIFSALFIGFELTLKMIAQSRAKTTALSLAADRVEYIRSLPYDQIGTIAGSPSGNIPQNRTVRLNDYDFNERVLIEYVDDPGDGQNAADSNLVTNDYKRFKIEYSWDVYGSPQSFSLISTLVPVAIETDTGGGSIRVNVTDANVNPLPGASVRLFNNTGTTTYDVTRGTDISGAALFAGFDAQSGYEIEVTEPGYSSDGTSQATATLISPNSPPFSVLENDLSTMNFSIDRLSDLNVLFYTSRVEVDVTEDFDDLLGMQATSSVVSSSSALTLSEAAGVYAGSGSVIFLPLTPTLIANWGMAKFETVLPAGTDARLRFYSSTSPAFLISDSNLPGNTAGFTNKHIDLSTLDISTYPTLVAGIELSTADTALTPKVDELTISYVESWNGLGSLPVTMTGQKSLGFDAGAAIVPKFQTATTTGSNGYLTFNNIEWENYRFDFGGSYVIADVCGSSYPISLLPNSSQKSFIKLINGTANNLRINVNDSLGKPVVEAAVDLTDGTNHWTKNTSWCGQTFINGLSDTATYDLEVSAPGFSTFSSSGLTMAGATVYEVVLNP